MNCTRHARRKQRTKNLVVTLSWSTILGYVTLFDSHIEIGTLSGKFPFFAFITRYNDIIGGFIHGKDIDTRIEIS